MKIFTSVLALVALQFGFTQAKENGVALAQLGEQTTSEICGNDMSHFYKTAQNSFPYLKGAIAAVGSQPMARWYVDSSYEFSDNNAMAAAMFANCRNGGKPLVSVYGIPNKDCAAGFSNIGRNKGWSDYNNFIWALHSGSQSRGVIYIIEPDAIGLLATHNCAVTYGYKDYVKHAISVLSQNPNAELFLDVGYWILSDDSKAWQVADIIRQVDPNGRVKGITINTSNYRSNSEMGAVCDRLVRVSGKPYRCIIDTSRNNRSPSNGEWCNYRDAGTGAFTKKNPGGNIAYYAWIKPPGTSDGQCTGRTSEAMVTNIKAGEFFPEHFVNVWNNGLFTQTQGYKRLDAHIIHSVPVFPSVQMQYNTGFTGNDVGNVLSQTAEGCIEICRQRSGCNAFSWTGSQGGTCWLKSAGAGSHSASGCHSAIVPPGGYMQYNQNYPGNDIGNVPRAKAEDCIGACRSWGGCKYFTWWNGVCWLKNARGGPKYTSDSHSGVIS